jgi:hypothetical protein
MMKKCWRIITHDEKIKKNKIDISLKRRKSKISKVKLREIMVLVTTTHRVKYLSINIFFHVLQLKLSSLH